MAQSANDVRIKEQKDTISQLNKNDRKSEQNNRASA